MSIDQPKSLMLVFDTSEYTGNFEREFCAYVTGQYGDCNVGRAQALLCAENATDKYVTWFEDHIGLEGDDEGCFRPVTIYTTEKHPGYRSIAILLREQLPEEFLSITLARAADFAAKYCVVDQPMPFAIFDVYYVNPTYSYTTERIELPKELNNVNTKV
jgi:hypothetical protein